MTIAAEELNPLVPHLAEIIVGLVAFGLLFWVLAKTVFPQFEKLYAERTDQIEGGLKRAEKAQAEADALKKRYEDQLAGARAEAARIRDDARAEGQQIKAELRTEAEEEAARIRARADEQVVAQREAAERSLRGEIGGLSAELAERILGSELADPSRRSATVDSFLTELDAMVPRQTAGAS
jgi:F-type H+-transporting ATPase subunit b